MLPGVTTKVEKDASGGKSMVVIEHKEDLNPQIIVKDTSGKALATYSVPTGAQVAVDEGTRIDAGSIIAKTPRQASKTQDITGGLPRVAELFEAHADLKKVMWGKWLRLMVSLPKLTLWSKSVIISYKRRYWSG